MVEHAIQLRFVAVKELQMETFWPIPDRQGYEPAPGALQFSSSPLNPSAHTLQVRLRFISGRDATPSETEIEKMKNANEQPFRVRAEVIGEFHIDITRFPVEKVSEWARINAPMILLPFLREQVYALSVRSGFQPLLLPMILVPTLVKETPEGSTTALPANRLYRGQVNSGVVPAELQTRIP